MIGEWLLVIGKDQSPVTSHSSKMPIFVPPFTYETGYLYDYSDYSEAYSIDGSLYYPVMSYPEMVFYVEGTTHDAHVYYQNDSAYVLANVSVQPVEKASPGQAGDQSGWFKVALTQAALDAATWGAILFLGSEFAPGERTDFWVRVTTPLGAEGNYTDVVLRIIGYYITSTFTIDAIIT